MIPKNNPSSHYNIGNIRQYILKYLVYSLMGRTKLLEEGESGAPVSISCPNDFNLKDVSECPDGFAFHEYIELDNFSTYEMFYLNNV